MSGKDGRGKPRPITGEEVQSWFERYSKPHPTASDCVELAAIMSNLAWPNPPAWPDHPLGLEELPPTPWNFEGVSKSADLLASNLPVMLGPYSVPAVPAGDAEGRAALIELQAAIERARPYLQNPYRKSADTSHRLKPWHMPAVLMLGPIFAALVRCGHQCPGITRNSIVAGVIQCALARMDHGTIETGAIGQHITRWLAASGMTINDMAAYVTKIQNKPG